MTALVDPQRLAADPGASAFVTAYAGSGKTKLLTDRLLRLMLSGVTPGRILCLTFTKAAAAEMATRLGRALGELTTLPDAELATRLHALCGRICPLCSPGTGPSLGGARSCNGCRLIAG